MVLLYFKPIFLKQFIRFSIPLDLVKTVCLWIGKIHGSFSVAFADCCNEVRHHVQAFEEQCCVPHLAFWKHPEHPQAEYSPEHPQAAGSRDVGSAAVTDLTEQLTSTEQLLAQLKELVREKDAELRSKDLQLKVLCMCSCQNHCLKPPFTHFCNVLQGVTAALGWSQGAVLGPGHCCFFPACVLFQDWTRKNLYLMSWRLFWGLLFF